MFDADRPIKTSDQDRLNRSPFAKYLARCLLDQTTNDRLVVGLYGGWGTGKTSLLNLVAQELNFAGTNLEAPDKPIILNFSPWNDTGQQPLIPAFFRRLKTSLHQADFLEQREPLIDLLEQYALAFQNKPAHSAFKSTPSFFSRLFRRLKRRSLTHSVFKPDPDPSILKAEINACLSTGQHKLIILIDNISRINDHDVRQLFQMISSMADFTKTAFLIALDKQWVIDALDRTHMGDAEKFLEKVVQLPFHVPPISSCDLEHILSDRLNDAVISVPEDLWNAEYWADIYYNSLKYFFNNCRDITRYVNTLNFSYPRLRDIVNPVDFFALTAIEVFLPAVYLGIRDNKDLFSDLLDNVYILDNEQLKKNKLRCDEIMSRAPHIPTDILLDLLVMLFPRLRYIYQTNMPFYHSPEMARKLRRICSPDVFDGYFRLSIQANRITESEFITILSLSANVTDFDQALTRLNQDGRILAFLDKLDGKTLNRLPKENIAAVIDALFDNGDFFPHGITSPLNLDTAMRIHRITHALLHRHETPEARFTLLQNAIAKANKSIYITVRELHEQGREHLEEEDTFLPPDFRDITPTQLHSLRQLTVSKIKLWARDHRLEAHPQLIALLFFWHDWDESDGCQPFLTELTSTDKGLVTFLMAALDKAISEASTTYIKNPAWEVYLSEINQLIPASMLKSRARAIFEDAYFEKLSEKEQLAIMIFLDIIHADTLKTISAS